MKNTASLGLIKQRERASKRERVCAREGGEQQEELGGEKSEKEKEEKRGRKKPV